MLTQELYQLVNNEYLRCLFVQGLNPNTKLYNKEGVFVCLVKDAS